MNECDAIQAVTREQVEKATPEPEPTPAWKWALAATSLIVIAVVGGVALLIELGYIIYMMATDLWAFRMVTLTILGGAAFVAIVWWAIEIVLAPTPTQDDGGGGR